MEAAVLERKVMPKFSSISAVSFLFVFCMLGQGRAAMLEPAEIDAARLLPPPPAAESRWAKSELAELHALASTSSPADIEAARRDDADEKPDLFNAALGFDITALPATTKMLNDVLKEEDTDSKAAKAYFHRDRPWIVDASIKSCVPVKPGPAANSYPSGHASLAFSMGVVLAALIPEKAQAILARAKEFGERRLVCGVHFPSDIVAGQQFGTVLAVRLMEKPAFKAEMDAARAELRAAHDVN